MYFYLKRGFSDTPGPPDSRLSLSHNTPRTFKMDSPFSLLKWNLLRELSRGNNNIEIFLSTTPLYKIFGFRQRIRGRYKSLLILVSSRREKEPTITTPTVYTHKPKEYQFKYRQTFYTYT